MSIELPAHLSYSSLNSYTTCGWRFYLERGLHIEGSPSWAQIGGSAVHEMTADYDTGLLPGDVLSTVLFGEFFDKATERQLSRSKCEESEIRATGRASKDWPNKRDKAWWLFNGPIIFDKWVSWMQMNPWQLLDLPGVSIANGGDTYTLPHQAVEFEVSDYIGDIYVKAYVDRAFVPPSGEVAVVDLKTGVMKPADALQLGVYAVLMEKTLGVRPTYGYYWMAEQGGTTEPVDLSRYTEDYLHFLFSSQKRGLEAGVYLPCVTNMCSGCGVRDFCVALGGSRASEVPLPTPSVRMTA